MSKPEKSGRHLVSRGVVVAAWIAGVVGGFALGLMEWGSPPADAGYPEPVLCRICREPIDNRDGCCTEEVRGEHFHGEAQIGQGPLVPVRVLLLGCPTPCAEEDTP